MMLSLESIIERNTIFKKVWKKVFARFLYCIFVKIFYLYIELVDFYQKLMNKHLSLNKTNIINFN